MGLTYWVTLIKMISLLYILHNFSIFFISSSVHFLISFDNKQYKWISLLTLGRFETQSLCYCVRLIQGKGPLLPPWNEATGSEIAGVTLAKQSWLVQGQSWLLPLTPIYPCSTSMWALSDKVLGYCCPLATGNSLFNGAIGPGHKQLTNQTWREKKNVVNPMLQQPVIVCEE